MKLSSIFVLSLVLLFASSGCKTGGQIKDKQPDVRVQEVKKTPEDTYREGLSLHKQGLQEGKVDYKQVIRLYEEALSQKPDMPEARMNLAAAYEGSGEYNQAVRQLSEINREQKAYPQAIQRIAQLYVRQKRYENALRFYQRYLSITKTKDVPAMLNLAALQIANKDYSGALTTSREVLSLDAANIVAYRLIARVYFLQDKRKMVYLVYNLSKKLKKDDAELLNLVGLTLMKDNETIEAGQLFESALKADPSSYPALMNLGSIALKYYDSEKALLYLSQAAKAYPNQKEALLAYALALRFNRKFKEAEAVYKEQILARFQNDPEATFGLGIIYLKFTMQYKEAIAAFRRYIGSQGARISDSHPSYAMLKESEQRLKMEEQMKAEDAAQKKKDASQPKPPADRKPPSSRPPSDRPEGPVSSRF